MKWRNYFLIGLLAFNAGCGTVRFGVEALGRAEDKLYDGMRRGMDKVAERGNKYLPRGFGNAEWRDYKRMRNEWRERKGLEDLQGKMD